MEYTYTSYEVFLVKFVRHRTSGSFIADKTSIVQIITSQTPHPLPTQIITDVYKRRYKDVLHLVWNKTRNIKPTEIELMK